MVEGDGDGAVRGRGGQRDVYIADLPENVTDDLIYTVFGAYGTILSCTCMQAKFQGQAGAAVVRFASAAEAEAVIYATNGQTPPGLAGPVQTRIAPVQGPQSAQNVDSKGGKATRRLAAEDES